MSGVYLENSWKIELWVMADLEIRETAQVIWELKDREDSTDMWIQGTLDEFFLLPGLPDSPVNEEIPTFP